MIPIYRAKKIDSDECVEGFFIEERIQTFEIGMPYKFIKSIKLFRSDCTIEIDPSTLEISFDSGDTWRDIEEVADMVNDLHSYLEQSGYIFNKG